MDSGVIRPSPTPLGLRGLGAAAIPRVAKGRARLDAVIASRRQAEQSCVTTRLWRGRAEDRMALLTMGYRL